MFLVKSTWLRGLVALFVLFLWFSSNNVNAAFVAPLSQVCSADAPVKVGKRIYPGVKPKLLINYIIENQWAGHRLNAAKVIDTNDNITETVTEKLRAITRFDHCDREAAGRCSVRDREAIKTIHLIINDPNLPEEDSTYKIIRIRKPSASERNKYEHLKKRYERPGATLQIGQLVDPQRRFIKVACLKYKPAPIPTRHFAQLDDPISEGNKREGYRLRITGKVDDLGLQRPNSLNPKKAKQLALLNKISPAQGLITIDRQAKSTTTEANAVLGWEFILFDEHSEIHATPYVHVHKRTNSKNVNQVDTLAGGLMFDADVQLFDGSGAENINFFAQYTTDSKANTEIASAKFIWTPSLLYFTGSPFGHSTNILGHGIAWEPTFRLVTEGGEVFDSGGNLSIAGTNEYLRTGFIAKLVMSGVPNSLFSQFKADATYKYMYGFYGQLRKFERFESSISYYFPNQSHLGLQLSYKHGHVEKTLQKEDLLKASIIARY